MQSGNDQPYQGIVDPSAEFEAGQIAEQKALGSQIVIGVSGGLRPCGIIDDVKTSAFSSNSIDEIHIEYVASPALDNENDLATPNDIVVYLDNPHILPKSFICTPIDVALRPKNGCVTIPAGTKLNNDMSGTGTPDSIYFRVSYLYRIPNMPGANTTAGSNRVTFWYSRIIAQTDQFDTNAYYPLTCPLFVNAEGRLTSHRLTEKHPAVAVCWAPPGINNNLLEFMWL